MKAGESGGEEKLVKLCSGIKICLQLKRKLLLACWISSLLYYMELCGYNAMFCFIVPSFSGKLLIVRCLLWNTKHYKSIGCLSLQMPKRLLIELFRQRNTFFLLFIKKMYMVARVWSIDYLHDGIPWARFCLNTVAISLYTRQPNWILYPSQSKTREAVITLECMTS